MGHVITQTRDQAFQTLDRAFSFLQRLQKLGRVFERVDVLKQIFGQVFC